MKEKKNIHVVGAVIVSEGEILCAQRGPDKSLPHLWEFPGGKIEEGETHQETLRREIEEEMYCKVRVGEQVDHTVHEYDFGIVHLTTYYCELQQGTPTLTEHIEFKWLSPKDLKSLEWAPADIPAIEKLSQATL
ncbi:(deoxy)nucleoside triphosphate pyrophosphohydrolase [Pontibacillus sp. ALD_SL1]|uniref:(deoxy)nucleoside triphosphate pyrophosphohydrolase n=1 Tax=Pontibacillus sp. ALD_SL1 TaxID=2777185 RepID=UPI001A9688A5|nr:(deoxy)nucleoside triphosphate pyrophosphohydrolase [Pontibacillus sp. ALD_SL1]QST00988.1 (deoxy)nucleoside triphosphate pyrophosphohydrolase [Pontibacillus sp. ALD_SL1]